MNWYPETVRFLSAVAAFLFVGFLTGMALLLLGDATGWLTVHGNTHGPLWWRATYLLIVLCGTPAFATFCAMRAARRQQ